ncbi:hypothetical protein HMPREF9145_2297 [Segatella salivae F0493]|uniref:Uncharacterized protein n=1 Tax=Segatella salivae F0493 TaxID=1395125 RepID=U2KP57_9BACT|nr:hypothetical protein HMPREF9145_2297 [Segatella salivae F0493]
MELPIEIVLRKRINTCFSRITLMDVTTRRETPLQYYKE